MNKQKLKRPKPPEARIIKYPGKRKCISTIKNAKIAESILIDLWAKLQGCRVKIK